MVGQQWKYVHVSAHGVDRNPFKDSTQVLVAGGAAGAFVLWEHVLKSQQEGNTETQPAAALTLLCCGS